MYKSLFLTSVALLLSPLGAAHAGTVINTNLPAGTSIVNIDATADGAGNYNGDQSLWYSPFSTQGTASLLHLPVSAGTYTFDIVDPADAAADFPLLTPTQLNSIQTAWTYNSPWITDYFVFDISAVTDSTQTQLFDGAFDPSSYNNAPSAYNGVVADGFANEIRTAATGGRDSTVDVTTYTFTAATTLVFAVPDYYLGDNQGGVSVVVTAVPEARSVTLLGVGGLLLMAWFRRRGAGAKVC